MSNHENPSTKEQLAHRLIRVITDFCWLDEKPVKVTRKKTKIVSMHGGGGNGFAMPMFFVKK